MIGMCVRGRLHSLWLHVAYTWQIGTILGLPVINYWGHGSTNMETRA